MDSIKADHGYNLDSKSVRNLLHVMSELTPEQRRDFLQFITGSPKLPIGGISIPPVHLFSIAKKGIRFQVSNPHVHRRLQAQRTPILL